MLPLYGFPKILLKRKHPSLPVLYLVINQAACLTSHTITGCFHSRRQPIPASRANLFCHKDAHGRPECKFPQVPGFDDCMAVPVLAKFDALWRSLLTSPAISLLVPHPRATQQRDPTFPEFAPQHQLSPQKNPSLTALPSQHSGKVTNNQHKQLNTQFLIACDKTSNPT